MDSSAKANCTLVLIVLKILVPKVIRGAIPITTRVFDTQEFTLSAFVAVVIRDVAFFITDRL